MIYLLFYDTDRGDREEWNVFYTPVEAFSTTAERDARMAFLRDAVDEDDEPCNYEFETRDIEFTDRADAPHVNSAEYDEDGEDVEQEWTDEINRW